MQLLACRCRQRRSTTGGAHCRKGRLRRLRPSPGAARSVWRLHSLEQRGEVVTVNQGALTETFQQDGGSGLETLWQKHQSLLLPPFSSLLILPLSSLLPPPFCPHEEKSGLIFSPFIPLSLET